MSEGQRLLLIGVSDPTDRAWLKERLTAHPWKTYEQPLRLDHEDELAKIPAYHIVCRGLEAREAARVSRRARSERRRSGSAATRRPSASRSGRR